MRFLQAILTKHLPIVLFVANAFKQFFTNFTTYKAMNMFMAKLVVMAFSMVVMVMAFTPNLSASKIDDSTPSHSVKG